MFIFGNDEAELRMTDRQFIEADPDTRIRAVWRIVCNKVIAFHARLKPNQQANYDVEDLLVECWIELREKDHKWEPERGRYSTFAGRVVHNLLVDIGDRAFNVHAPRNSSSRIKKYERAPDTGDERREARKRKAVNDVLRCRAGSVPISPDDKGCRGPGGGDPAEHAAIRDDEELANRVLCAAARSLTKQECLVLILRRGRPGRRRASYTGIAARLGVSINRAREIEREATAKVVAVAADHGFTIEESESLA